MLLPTIRCAGRSSRPVSRGSWHKTDIHASRQAKHERDFWQRQLWEHQIRDGEFHSRAVINLRALPEQRDIIDHAATLLGKNRTDFMFEVACSSAQAVILDQIFSA
ncbi:MAG: DUF1778 domain-containing protein [Candidatus Nitrotoga sp.]